MRFTVEQVLGRGVNIIANDEMIHKNRFFDTYQLNIDSNWNVWIENSNL